MGWEGWTAWGEASTESAERLVAAGAMEGAPSGSVENVAVAEGAVAALAEVVMEVEASGAAGVADTVTAKAQEVVGEEAVAVEVAVDREVATVETPAGEVVAWVMAGAGVGREVGAWVGEARAEVARAAKKVERAVVLWVEVAMAEVGTGEVTAMVKVEATAAVVQAGETEVVGTAGARVVAVV